MCCLPKWKSQNYFVAIQLNILLFHFTLGGGNFSTGWTGGPGGRPIGPEFGGPWGCWTIGPEFGGPGGRPIGPEFGGPLSKGRGCPCGGLIICGIGCPGPICDWGGCCGLGGMFWGLGGGATPWGPIWGWNCGVICLCCAMVTGTGPLGAPTCGCIGGLGGPSDICGMETGGLRGGIEEGPPLVCIRGGIDDGPLLDCIRGGGAGPLLGCISDGIDVGSLPGCIIGGNDDNPPPDGIRGGGPVLATTDTGGLLCWLIKLGGGCWGGPEAGGPIGGGLDTEIAKQYDA